MTDFTVKIHGLERLQSALRHLGSDLDVAVDDAVKEEGELAIRRIIKKINQPGRGRLYRRYNPKRLHRASAPKEPPATDTGRLVKSIRNWGVKSIGPGEISIGSALLYARILEFGMLTKNILPRPVWVPEIRVLNKRIPDAVRRKVRGILAR